MKIIAFFAGFDPRPKQALLLHPYQVPDEWKVRQTQERDFLCYEWNILMYTYEIGCACQLSFNWNIPKQFFFISVFWSPELLPLLWKIGEGGSNHPFVMKTFTHSLVLLSTYREQQMLLNLHKKSWMEGLTLQNYNEHSSLNEDTVKEILNLATAYNKVSVMFVFILFSSPYFCSWVQMGYDSQSWWSLFFLLPDALLSHCLFLTQPSGLWHSKWCHLPQNNVSPVLPNFSVFCFIITVPFSIVIKDVLPISFSCLVEMPYPIGGVLLFKAQETREPLHLGHHLIT